MYYCKAPSVNSSFRIFSITSAKVIFKWSLGLFNENDCVCALTKYEIEAKKLSYLNTDNTLISTSLDPYTFYYENTTQVTEILSSNLFRLKI